MPGVWAIGDVRQGSVKRVAAAVGAGAIAVAMIHEYLQTSPPEARMKDYVFVGEWRIAAEPAQVWALVRRIDGWREWWPSMHRVRAAGRAGRGRAGDLAVQLPDPVAVRRHLRGGHGHGGPDGRSGGRGDRAVRGRGSWGVRMIDGGTLVRFHCRLRPHLRWVRVISPAGPADLRLGPPCPDGRGRRVARAADRAPGCSSPWSARCAGAPGILRRLIEREMGRAVGIIDDRDD